MTTFDDLLRARRAARDTAARARDAAQAELVTLRRSLDEPDTTITEEQVRAAIAARDTAADRLAAADADLSRVEAEAAADARLTATARTLDNGAGHGAPKENAMTATAPRPYYDQVARVGAEERTYRADRDPDGRGFLLDMTRSFLFADPTSSERLARHAAESRVEHSAYLERAAGTSAFAGLTVPQYLTEYYAPAVAALRPFADICNRHPLPTEGMTVNISRITTASSVALQASENTAVSETNLDDTLLTLNVLTAAGQQTISRQAVERGTGIEEVTLADLFARYATALDSTLINQASTGLDAVAQGFTYTDASPTTAELWPKLYQAQNGVEAALLGQAFPSHFVMHPRRWNWLCSQTGSVWPSVAGSVVPPQAFAAALPNGYGAGARAVLANGMQIVTDANITTTGGGGTEDVIYAVAASECHLWEDPAAPVFIRAEQPAAGSLGVLLVVYGYFAYTHSRYTNGAAKITGTGLVAPVF